MIKIIPSKRSIVRRMIGVPLVYLVASGVAIQYGLKYKDIFNLLIAPIFLWNFAIILYQAIHSLKFLDLPIAYTDPSDSKIFIRKRHLNKYEKKDLASAEWDTTAGQIWIFLDKTKFIFHRYEIIENTDEFSRLYNMLGIDMKPYKIIGNKRHRRTLTP